MKILVDIGDMDDGQRAEYEHAFRDDDPENDGIRLFVETEAFARRRGRGKQMHVILVPMNWDDPDDGAWYCKSAWLIDD